MFTAPSTSSGGIILVARPSASTGTITNAGNAYDLPTGRPDDYPYTTSADRATVTGSAVAGAVDYDIVEFNTFPSRSKTTFSNCSLSVVYSPLVTWCQIPPIGFGLNYVTSQINVQYQIDGTNWVTLDDYYYLPATDTALDTGQVDIGGFFTVSKVKSQLNISLPASSFPSNLNSLKVRFRMGTCTNAASPTLKSSASYSVWDIRANLT